jgi:hypothetical protein
MKPDVVIVVPPEMDPTDMLREVTLAADELTEKHVLQPPIFTRFLDGHGNQFMEFDLNWDEDGHSALEGKGFTDVPQADGVFLVMKDSEGKTATVKLEVRGQDVN